MKYSFKILIHLLLFATFLVACENTDVVTPYTKSVIKQIIEHRFTPLDSVTVVTDYLLSGDLSEEKYSTQQFRRSHSIKYVYGSINYANFVDKNNEYEVVSLGDDRQPISVNHFFHPNSSWIIRENDSLYYNQKQIVKQKHWDYYFVADGQPYAFKYPLWYSERTFRYDIKGRIALELDTVFITHDMPAGSLVIQPAKAKYIFTNKTYYHYNDRDKLVERRTVSGSDEKLFITYSNGLSIYKQFNSGWNTYAKSWPGRFITGFATYAYAYDLKGRLNEKRITFIDKFGKHYTSDFRYFYY